MKPIRREVLNGLFVLVLSTLLSAGFAAFQIKFDIRLWVLILMSIDTAVTGYVVFESVLSAEDRENEWLKRVGTPARTVYGQDGGQGVFAGYTEAINALTPNSDYTAMSYYPSETLRPRSGDAGRLAFTACFWSGLGRAGCVSTSESSVSTTTCWRTIKN